MSASEENDATSYRHRGSPALLVLPELRRYRSYRWFFRGLTNTRSLVSAFALFSARFSRIDFPDFFAPVLRGDFPDIVIHRLSVSIPQTIPTLFFKANPSPEMRLTRIEGVPAAF